MSSALEDEMLHCFKLVTAVAVGLAILAIHLHSTRHSEIEAMREDPTCDANAKVLAPVPLHIVEFGE